MSLPLYYVPPGRADELAVGLQREALRVFGFGLTAVPQVRVTRDTDDPPATIMFTVEVATVGSPEACADGTWQLHRWMAATTTTRAELHAIRLVVEVEPRLTDEQFAEREYTKLVTDDMPAEEREELRSFLHFQDGGLRVVGAGIRKRGKRKQPDDGAASSLTAFEDVLDVLLEIARKHYTQQAYIKATVPARQAADEVVFEVHYPIGATRESHRAFLREYTEAIPPAAQARITILRKAFGPVPRKQDTQTVSAEAEAEYYMDGYTPPVPMQDRLRALADQWERHGAAVPDYDIARVYRLHVCQLRELMRGPDCA